MMELKLVIQKKNEPPRLPHLNHPIFDFSHNETIVLALMEAGMKSGEPSVLIISSDNTGSAVIQTSLDKFLAGATGMMAAAEKHFGWKQQEGYATLVPPSKEARKILLEALKKELEEWDEVDES
jgi:hypothetical protein